MQNEKKQINVYQLVTDRILELLAQGIIPWRQEWSTGGIPMNMLSRRPYRGVNVLLLSVLKYTQNLYLTFDQVKSIGASIRKGEKGHLVVFTKMTEKEELVGGELKKVKQSYLRYYKVFNVEQVDNIPADLLPTFSVDEASSIEQCEVVLGMMPNCPKVQHKTNEAYYNPTEDIINMPKKKSFMEIEHYYGTLFHELIHSTGHSSRLNRKEVVENPKFGTNMYSLEELVAEMGACYLKSYTSIADLATLSNSAAYIDSWVKVLNADNRFIIKAASTAQKCVEYILNVPVEVKAYAPKEVGPIESILPLSKEMEIKKEDLEVVAE